jgi:hypothetical protein
MKVHIDAIDRHVLAAMRVIAGEFADGDEAFAERWAREMATMKTRALRARVDSWGFLDGKNVHDWAKLHQATAESLCAALREVADAQDRAKAEALPS